MPDPNLAAAQAAMTDAGAAMEAALGHVDDAIAACATRQTLAGGGEEAWPELAQWKGDLEAHRTDLARRRAQLVGLIPPSVKAAAEAP